MAANGNHDGNALEFTGTIEPGTSGRHGYTIRILPRNPDLAAPQAEGLVLWD